MIIAVTGTGTGVGKTHVACALVGGLLDRGVRAVGWKPVESGSDGGPGSDEALLAAVSGGAAAPTLRLREPISPHLAARREGIAIDRNAIRSTLDDLDRRHAVVVLELAGGLCSPFDDQLDNVDWLAWLAARVIVVAPDRLGVLHDASALLRAARAADVPIHAIVLVPPVLRDASTGTNAAELRARHTITVVEIARAPVAELRRDPALASLTR